ncbi:hypothetical protein VSDG_07351 [Cytospora chrysosperma]|uniref:Uncharacterized protein n=1 Tax=Cytospora chrysosperma TaxID=252740 RepID=A0A423VQ82_CYTCH|nr:hypothetical protein VSDG_07351 [Valsa sordida]
MADRTSLEDKSQCVATIGLLGFSYGSQIGMARRKERDYIKDELQHQVSDDKATKVIPGHPDGIEAGSMNMFQHVLGGDMDHHETSDARRSDPTPTTECRGIFVRQPCPKDADLTAWYALGLCMVFCIWGGLIYLRQ